MEQKLAFCKSESWKKMLNTTTWHMFHAMQHLLKIFYNHSINQWPTFILEKVTHDAICTLSGDMHTRNVATMQHHNSRAHVKFRNFSEASYECSGRFLGATMSHWHFLTLYLMTVRTVAGAEIGFLSVRVVLKYRKYHILAYYSRHEALSLNFL